MLLACALTDGSKYVDDHSVLKLVKNEDIVKESMKIEANFLTNYSNVSEYPVDNNIETHYILI